MAHSEKLDAVDDDPTVVYAQASSDLLPCVQLVAAVIVLYPLAVWDDTVYLPKEYYCSVFFSIFEVCHGLLPLTTAFLAWGYSLFTFVSRCSCGDNQTIGPLKSKVNTNKTALFFDSLPSLSACALPAVIPLLLMLITGKSHPLGHRTSTIQGSLSVFVSDFPPIETDLKTVQEAEKQQW